MENVWENVKSELKAPRKGRKGAKRDWLNMYLLNCKSIVPAEIAEERREID